LVSKQKGGNILDKIAITNHTYYERFHTLCEMSNELSTLCKNGEKVYPGYTHILGEVWHFFYSPEIVIVNKTHSFHEKIIDQLLNQQTLKEWRIFTQLDELFSILSTLVVGDELLKQLQFNSIHYMKAEIKQNNDRLQLIEYQLKEKNLSLIDTERLLFQQKTIKQRIKHIETRIESNKSKPMTINVEAISSAISKQKQSIVEIKKGIHQLSSIDGKKLSSVPLKDQILFAEHLMNNEIIKKIAEMTGRFKKIALQKQKIKEKQTMERKEITFSQELSQLLPLEHAHLVLPQSKLDFYRRFAESQTLAFDKKGKERKGRGPIIICMDESSSMHPLKAEAKAFCLALLFIAKKQKRDITIIPFASDIGEVTVFKKGKATAEQVLHFSKAFLKGGTNYEKPLTKSLEILKESRFNQADIIFVTDGSSFLPTSFIDSFNEVKKKRKFECTSVVLTNLFSAIDQDLLQKFSDKIINVQNLFEAEDIFTIC